MVWKGEEEGVGRIGYLQSIFAPGSFDPANQPPRSFVCLKYFISTYLTSLRVCIYRPEWASPVRLREREYNIYIIHKVM